MDLVWQLRLEQTARWLQEPDITVSEVAYGVGFRSISHFCNRFRDHFGVSPSASARRLFAPTLNETPEVCVM
ncbi:MAG TPA: helix-turn-helix domain-containing protein, partial [Rhodothermales bacterium]|nr:helix-turn-helix domain-containing protein [Rhodothermales bacterium]